MDRPDKRTGARSKVAVLSRRETLQWAARGAVWVGVAGCASIIDDARRRYGWEAAAAIPPGPYRTQIWKPPEQTTAPIFVVVLVKPSVAPARILEPYTVEDRGEVQPAPVIADLRARYPGLLPSAVEVEPLVVDGVEIGYVIRTRNINVYADLDRSLGQYRIRLGALGRYRLKPRGR